MSIDPPIPPDGFRPPKIPKMTAARVALSRRVALATDHRVLIEGLTDLEMRRLKRLSMTVSSFSKLPDKFQRLIRKAESEIPDDVLAS